MKFDPKIHHRRSIRLKGYDYSQSGAYFVTMVTHQRECLFGEVVDREMILNDFGKIADEFWRVIPDHFPNVELGAHIVMPNHVHGIIAITVGATHASPLPKNGTKPGSLGVIVGSYKSAVTKRINRKYTATKIWQRNFYEHIIRNDDDMECIWNYIESNPIMWADDDENPAHL
jgi:putative transposase